MTGHRSVAYVGDAGATIPCFYQKIDPATGAPFTSASVTAVDLAAYNLADGAAVQASTPMTWDATLQGYRHNLAYSGSARRILIVMTPTRAPGVSAQLTPVEYEKADLADTLARIGLNSEASVDPSTAAGTLMAKLRGLGVDTDTVFAELEAIEGSGWAPALDNLHQAKVDREQTSSQISALDLRQSTSLVVPRRVAPSNTYVARLRVRDDDGVLVDADALPVVEILEAPVTGVSISSVTSDGGTGLYKFSIILDGTAEPGTVFTLRASWQRTEGGVVNNEEALRSVEVDDFDATHDQILSDLTTILGRIGESTDSAATTTLFGRDQRTYEHATHATWGLEALHTIVADIQAKITDGTYGLSALNDDIDAVAAALGADGSISVHEKLGAFTAVLSLFAMLGGFTQTETLKKHVEAIQGMLP